MKLSNISDIIQWMISKTVKTVRTKLDKEQNQWGLLACDFKDHARMKYDLHFNNLVIQDVTLVVTNHQDGKCGRVGYAEGKPVVTGQWIPDISTANSVWYHPNHQKFYMADHGGEVVEVTSLKWMWLHPGGRACGIV